MFTAKGFFLFLSIIILLATAWNTDITMVYIFFVIASVMFILSFIHLQFNTPDISVTREVQDIAYEDDILDVKLEMQNNRPLNMYFIELVERFPGAPKGREEVSLFILNMKDKEKRRINYTINCYKRGLHKIGPVFIVFQDALGFFRKRKKLNVFSEILVYPRPFKIFSFPTLASGSVAWMGVETKKISGDSHEFFGVREYQQGDTMTRIHWPTTARHDKLIVKEYERNIFQEATLILDLKQGHNIGIGKETTLEYSVKLASSIAGYLLEEGVFMQIAGYGKEHLNTPFGKGESHIYKILENLSKVTSDGDIPFERALEETIFVTPPRSTLIAIMLDTDINSLTRLAEYKIKGVKLIVIVLNTATFGRIEKAEDIDRERAKKFDEILASLEAYVYKISKGDDLEKKFETV